MEISSFETSAFNKRRIDKAEATYRSPFHVAKSALPVLVILSSLIFGAKLLSDQEVTSIFGGPIITPSRLLVAVTLFMIAATPMLKTKRTKQTNVPDSVRSSVSSVQEAHAQQLALSPVRTYGGAVPEFRRSISPLRTNADILPPWRPVTPSKRAPAPFVDDVHSTQKHEFTDSMPAWARKFEELLVMPHIINPLVKSLADSDNILTQCFSRFGLRLSHQPASSTGTEIFGVICLSDRFLPNPLGNDPAIVAEWQRRQLLESLVNIPGFPPTYRDYVVGRITTWASRGGLRFAYRHDSRPDDEGPTDSHILSHLLFTSLDSLMGGGFKDRYVVRASSGVRVLDDFQTLFASVGNALSGGHYSNRIVWLEENAKVRGGPVHFNIGTNQRIYGVPPGGGNMIEAICLFFYLLRRLSPTSAWVQIPHEIRAVVESALGSTETPGSLTGSFFTGSVKSSASALPDFSIGH